MAFERRDVIETVVAPRARHDLVSVPIAQHPAYVSRATPAIAARSRWLITWRMRIRPPPGTRRDGRRGRTGRASRALRVRKAWRPPRCREPGPECSGSASVTPARSSPRGDQITTLSRPVRAGSSRRDLRPKKASRRLRGDTNRVWVFVCAPYRARCIDQRLQPHDPMPPLHRQA
jgi:hypothetical protein